jgi:aryl-alcohol dehydrogenase-like predicted oxidoreductase
MQTREFGKSSLVVPAIGLGCMGMSTAYGERDDECSTATIRHAIDIGAGLLDTSDAYANGVNEELVGKAIAGRHPVHQVRQHPAARWGTQDRRPPRICRRSVR